MGHPATAMTATRGRHMADDDRTGSEDATSTRSLDTPERDEPTRRLGDPDRDADHRDGYPESAHGDDRPAFLSPGSDADTQTPRGDTSADVYITDPPSGGRPVPPEEDRLDRPTETQVRQEPEETRRIEAPVAPPPAYEHEYQRDDEGDREAAVWRDEREVAEDRRPAKTSAAAFFGFLFGFSALLTFFLGPVGIVFGLLGLILGVAGRRRAADEARVSGGAIATTAVVLSVIGLLLSLAVTVAAGAYLTDAGNRSSLDDAVQSIRDTFEGLPTF